MWSNYLFQMIVGNNTKELDYDMRVCDGMETTSLMPEDGFIQFPLQVVLVLVLRQVLRLPCTGGSAKIEHRYLSKAYTVSF